MQITNVSLNTVELGDLKQPTGTGKGVVLAPGASITIYDEDAEKSAGLKLLITAGTITKTGDLEPGETSFETSLELADKIAAWVISADTKLQWKNHSGVVATTDAGAYDAAASARTVSLTVANASDIVDTLNSTATALITVTGTASAARLTLNGVLYSVSGPVTLTLSNGVAPVILSTTETSTVTVIMTITSCVPTGLTHSATMTYTFN